MYLIKQLLVVVAVILTQTLTFKVNCQCMTETRRAVRNYGQILPVGIPVAVENPPDENSTTLKSEDHENKDKTTTSTTVAPPKSNFTQKFSENERENHRQEGVRSNNPKKDNNTFVYSAPVITPTFQYNQKLSEISGNVEKPILEIRESNRRSNNSEKYRKEENVDTIVYNGYIVAPRVNITRKAADGENNRRNISENKDNENVTFPHSTLDVSSRTANHTFQKKIKNEEVYFRVKENESLRNGNRRQTISNRTRSDQREETSTENTLRRKKSRKQKKVEDDEDK